MLVIIEKREEYNQKFQQLLQWVTALKEKLNVSDAELNIDLKSQCWTFPEYTASNDPPSRAQQILMEMCEKLQKDVFLMSIDGLVSTLKPPGAYLDIDARAKKVDLRKMRAPLFQAKILFSMAHVSLAAFKHILDPAQSELINQPAIDKAIQTNTHLEYISKKKKLMNAITALREKLNISKEEWHEDFDEACWSFPHCLDMPFLPTPLQNSLHAIHLDVQQNFLQTLSEMFEYIDWLNSVIKEGEMPDELQRIKIRGGLQLRLSSIKIDFASAHAALEIGRVMMEKTQFLHVHVTSQPVSAPIEIKAAQPSINERISEIDEELILEHLYKDLIRYESSFRKNASTTKLDTEKLACIKLLKNSLSGKESDQDKARSFCRTLEKLKTNAAMHAHRAPAWKRFIANLISCLTVLPAVYRLAKCYSRYKQFNFFKPNSGNLLNHLAEKVQKVPNFAKG